jgi:hypothetical protein
MKRSSNNSHIGGKPTKQVVASGRWGLGSWFSGLAEFVRHKNVDDRLKDSDLGANLPSAVNRQDDTGDYPVAEGRVSNVCQGSVEASSDKLAVNRAGLLSVKRSSTFTSGDLDRRASSLSNYGGDVSLQTKTPLVRRFRRERLLSCLVRLFPSL